MDIENEATEEDMAEWRALFKKSSQKEEFWIPDWHFHPHSGYWVYGLRPADECYVCDLGHPLLIRAMIAGDPVPSVTCISINEEDLERLHWKILSWGGSENIPRCEDEFKPIPYKDMNLNPEIPARRDDFSRWKKQFGPMLVKIADRSSHVVRDFKENVEDDMQVPEGTIQINILGQPELIPFKKGRKKS
jgi:hypothetical protein